MSERTPPKRYVFQDSGVFGEFDNNFDVQLQLTQSQELWVPQILFQSQTHCISHNCQSTFSSRVVPIFEMEKLRMEGKKSGSQIPRILECHKHSVHTRQQIVVPCLKHCGALQGNFT